MPQELGNSTCNRLFCVGILFLWSHSENDGLSWPHFYKSLAYLAKFPWIDFKNNKASTQRLTCMGLCHWQTKTKLVYCNWLIVSFCSNSTKPLDIVAIDNLPSLLPRESSIQFADSIMPYLLKLSEVFPHYFFFSYLPVLVCCYHSYHSAFK